MKIGLIPCHLVASELLPDLDSPCQRGERLGVPAGCAEQPAQFSAVVGQPMPPAGYIHVVAGDQRLPERQRLPVVVDGFLVPTSLEMQPAEVVVEVDQSRQ